MSITRNPRLAFAALVVPLVVAALVITVPGTGVSHAQGPELQGGQLTATSPGTAFTYQGHLTDALGDPVDGTSDFRLRLYDAASGGTQVGSDQVLSGVGVNNGYFFLAADFGAGVFDGEARWLEVAVKAPTAPDYTAMPRQAVRPVPYALIALGAPWSGVSGIPPGFADGTDNDTTYDAAAGLVLTDTTFSLDSAYADGRYWSLSGNAGTTPSAHFLGTTDNQALEIRVNNARILRLEPDYPSPNVIAGHQLNSASGDAQGATIGGGGADIWVYEQYFASYPNQVSEDFGTVGGGLSNEAGGWAATVAGGEWNNATGDYSTIGGGGGPYDTRGIWRRSNAATGTGATVGGGQDNSATGDWATVGGGNHNKAKADFATIAGGGDRIDYEAEAANSVTDNYGTVGGGSDNHVGNDNGDLEDAVYGTISGGRRNTASAVCATVGGGYTNTVTGGYGTISGGLGNAAIGSSATVSGGHHNSAEGSTATVAGGSDNRAGTGGSTVSGGVGNAATGVNSTVSGGYHNYAEGTSSIVSGGYENTAGGHNSTVGGGHANSATGAEATVPGGGGNSAEGDFSFAVGRDNTASGEYASVSGGYSNTVASSYATVGGGRNNLIDATGYACTVGGGQDNVAYNDCSTISGGSGNTAHGSRSTVGGGYENDAGGGYATVAGGEACTAGHLYAAVGGGRNNQATGQYSTVSGGSGNEASGTDATVPGGQSNIAQGAHSLAAGYQAQALHDGSFVWSDSSIYVEYPSAADHEFRARASGGVYFHSNPLASTGVYLAPGATSWQVASDRALKENLSPVDAQDVLESLASMPVHTWNLVTQDPAIRHIGPVAQDFHASFGFGESETAINMEDADGVTMAAIQGLYQLVQEQAVHIESLEQRLTSLEAVLAQQQEGGEP